MGIERFVNINGLTNSRWYKALLLITVIAIVVAQYFVFVVAPNERVMGAVQRIFYFHVASAITTYSCIGVFFVASIYYLATRKAEWDLVGISACRVALVFCSIVLVTGIIWGHSAWNTWWNWEPRLVSSLILWLVLFSAVLLRAFSANDTRRENFTAVFGVLSAVNVPIVMFAIKLFPHIQQLHPQVVANQGLKDSRYVVTFLLSIVTIHLLAGVLFVLTLMNQAIERRITALSRTLSNRSPNLRGISR